MGIVPPPAQEPVVGDPDDHRPDSRWGFAVDPEGAVDVGVIYETIAVGDRIPLHRHTIDEVVLVLDGQVELTYGDEVHRVGPGSTAFVRAGVVHGARNVGDTGVRYVAIFPQTTVDMTYLERLPAPGTEDDPPSASEWDMRTGAVRRL